MKTYLIHTLGFLALLSQALCLIACSAEKETPGNASDLILISRDKGSETTKRVTQEQLHSLPTFTGTFQFEANGEEKKTKAVYLTDVMTAFQDNQELNFWIVNCGDKYQSNFTPTQLETNRPYLILEVDDQPLTDWLAATGHPEWGPNIINIENPTGLLDPSHKNPWGVSNIIAVRREAAVQGWGSGDLNDSANRGRDLFLNSCASCHQSGNGLIGGSVSTRPISILSIFASNTEPYFRKILIAPKETNPLAERMPSYAHWAEDNVRDLIQFLTALNK